MTKTQEELEQLKLEYESLSNKLKELSDEELKIVTGGTEVKVKEYKIGLDISF